MTCEGWRIEISAWLDGALSGQEEESLRRHLSTCSSCSEFLAVHRKIGEVVLGSQLEPLTPPPGIWLRVEGELRRRRAAEESPALGRLWDWLRVPQWGYAAASAVLLLVSGLVAVQTRTEQLPDSRWLAELDSFSVQASGNPFLTPVEEGNPFFSFEGQEPDNPFKGGGEVR